MGIPNQSSKISRKARNVPLEWNQWYGSIIDSLTTRTTEKDGIECIRYGEQIAASNNAAKLYNPEFIQCSGGCGLKKHYTEFDRCAGNTWRFHRDHRCKQCRKRDRLIRNPVISASEEARLRAKANQRRKGTNLPELPARSH